jgi:NADPH:quinone reductase-like Zn-dependent oxidoreductase
MVRRRDFLRQSLLTGAAATTPALAATVAGAALPATAALAAAPGKAKTGAASTQTTRAWVIGNPAGIGNLKLVDRPLRSPGHGEVLIEVHASSINARDKGIVARFFPVGVNKADVPLAEGAGQVLAVGPGVARIKPGDRVTCCHFPTWVDGRWDPAVYESDVGNTMDGWLADRIVLPESGLVKLPDAISYEAAATLASSGVTAWHALTIVARVKPGDTVLTLGTGGVSTIGLQLAKMAGARVVVTSSSDEKLARVKQLGADFGVNYKATPEWGAEVAKLTGGVDIVLENVGRPTLDQSMNACGNGATIVMIGTGPLPPQLPKMPNFYQKNLMMKAISAGSRRMFEDLVAGLAANRWQPVIEKTFEFSDAIAAFREMERSDHVGKVLIRHR